MLIFEKKLTKSEREKHCIRVPVKTLSQFPSFGEIFEIKVASKRVHAKIDTYYRLLGIGEKAFNELNLVKPGAVALLEKTSKGEFILKSKDKMA